MSKLSNDQGRAYEFVCLNELYNEITKVRNAQIIQNSSFYAAQRAYNTLTSDEKVLYKQSALAMIPSIFDCEPRIMEDDNDTIELFIQKDDAGKKGDVRDIIILRNSIKWEIGLSIKHNHFAVKHNRLSPTIDFGKIWYNIPCSDQYWNDIKPIFDYLENEKTKNTKFSNLPDKDNDVYKPLIQAFINEIKRQYISHKDLPQKIVEYLLSKFDFYKVISIDSKKVTQIQSYNIHGTLNASAKNRKPNIIIPVAALPKQILSLDFLSDRSNTAVLCMDGGWQFTFRIHNAETYVIPSLKFDIQIVGLPVTIITINCIWN